MIVSDGQLAVERTKQRSYATVFVFSGFYDCVFLNLQLWNDQRIVVYE